MTEKGTPLEAATEVVSLDAAAIAAKEAALITSGVKKKPADRTPEELKAVRKYHKLTQSKSRAKKNARKDAVNGRYNSVEEVSKKEAREILKERGIKNSHVADTLVELAQVAAQTLKLPFNDHLLRHGLQATKAATDKNFQPTQVDDAPVVGDLITRRECHAVWDFSISWREPITFEEFIELRRKCKTDPFFLGKEIIGKDFWESPHGHWRDFFPQFNPDTLPPNYTQEDMKRWLSEQGRVEDGSLKKEFLLLSSRNAYKSSWNLIWLLSAHLCCPDLRALLCSETTRLSKSFIRGYRSYWEVKSEPTRFQQLFPEYCIPVGDGSTLSFESPMAHLDLLSSSAESTSADSTVAGNRAEIILADDIISNLTCGNEEMRQASTDKFDLLMKLLETTGLVIIAGTPWHTEDLYATLIKRNQEDPDKPLAVRIDPAWKIRQDKPEAKSKSIHELVEDDVTLLFPSRLSWKFLQKELRRGERFFRSQNLVEFLQPEEALELLNFDRALLLRNTVHAAAAPTNGDVVIVADIAHSTSPKADRSAIAICRIISDVATGEKSMVVLDVIAERMRSSDFAVKLVLACRKWNPRSVVVERTPTWDLLQAEINRATQKYPAHVPLYWKTPSNVKNAKFLRLKGLEGLIAAARIKFVSGPYIDTLFAEMEKLDGTTGGGSTRKDDQCDALGICQQMFCPAIHYQTDKKEESDELQEEQIKQALKAEQYSRIFGNMYTPPPPSPVLEEQPQAPRDERLKVFGRGKWRM